MSLSKQKVENRLLAHHLFPRVARRADEFPPCFVSHDLTPRIASLLISTKAERPDGYGFMSLRATRYDLAPRRMEVLHPTAFAKIVRQLKVSWEEWHAIENNPSSALRLTDHADKRVFSMISNSDVDELMFPGARFLAKVDVTNFYDSIYTHAIPWAVHGVQTGKAVRDDAEDWTNALDKVLRLSRRKETTGVSVGPGTSAIVGEIMMNAIDERLRKSGYEFRRYIDDYFAVFATRNEAESFIHDVRDELLALKLTIHPSKTSISELPLPLAPRWMRDLRALSRAGGNTTVKLLDLIDQVIEYPETAEEEGPLRWALVSVESILSGSEFTDDDRIAIVDRLLVIGYLKPVAISSACRLLCMLPRSMVSQRANLLNRILREHVSNRRTDASTWLIYILLKNKDPLEPETLDSIKDSQDALAIALLTADSNYHHVVTDFIKALESRNPPTYMRDEYWLVYYQLWLAGHPSEDAEADDYYREFEPLYDNQVSFIDLDSENKYIPTHLPPVNVTGASQSGAGGITTGTRPYVG